MFDPYRGTNNYNGIGSTKNLSQSYVQNILSNLGLSAQFILDAADGRSGKSGEQLWYDTSGNGQNFFLGADGNITASDPTFTGVQNSLTKDTYYSFNGSNYFNFPGSSPSWAQGVSLDGGVLSGGIWINTVAGLSVYFASRTQVATAIGFSFFKSATEKLSFAVGNGTAAALATTPMVASIPTGSWNFLGITINESLGTNGLTLQVNSTQEQFTSTYTSPSASVVTALKIGSHGNGNTPIPTGHQINMAVFDNTYWGATKLNDFYNATKGRFA